MKLFSNLLIFFCFLIIFNDLNGQFGLRLKYNDQSLSNWDNNLGEYTQNNSKIFNTGYEVGLDYWFKLKKRRIEFMPEISYNTSRTTFINSTGIDHINLSGINFNFHSQIYALDMEGDCDCPTFSKQGASINKGLFFHFTPGLGYHTTSTKLSENSNIFGDEVKQIVFRAGLGIGLDIGLSDLLTITPILSYYFHSNMQWDNMPIPGRPQPGQINNQSDNLKQLQFTLRLGFRPDYGRRGRRR